MLKYATCPSDVGQHYQIALVHDAHGLDLPNHSIYQVWRLREFANRRPEWLPQLGLLSWREWRMRGVDPLVACGLSTLSRELFCELIPSAS